MNLINMRTNVRRDLHDEDSENYRWTNDEIDRQIAHAVKDYSGFLPLEQKATLETVNGSREIDISSLTNRVVVEAVDYPVGQVPPRYQRFALWGNTITLLGDDVPDGSHAQIFYGCLHTLTESTSTIPARHEDLVAAGACGYAALEGAVYSVNRVNVGGTGTPESLQTWGKERLDYFQKELKRLGRNNRVRMRSLYSPCYQPVSKATDKGPQ